MNKVSGLLKTACFIFSCWGLNLALAQEPPAKSFFLQNLQTIPRYLMTEAGLKTYRGIDLEKFIKKSNRLNIEWREGLSIQGKGPNGEVRRGGENSSRSKRIRFAEGSLIDLNSIELFRVFALHEALGALGYNDDDYAISWGMAVFRHLALRTTPENALATLDSQTPPTDLLAEKDGGGTGVGKGGDGLSIRLKGILLDRYFAQSARVEESDAPRVRTYLENFTRLSVESHPDYVFAGQDPNLKSGMETENARTLCDSVAVALKYGFSISSLTLPIYWADFDTVLFTQEWQTESCQRKILPLLDQINHALEGN
jgi:hypothetical protein